MSPHCIVIGASAGGLESLREVVAQLPADLPAPVFVVMHLPANHKSYLPEILSSTGPLPALHPQDHTRIEVDLPEKTVLELGPLTQFTCPEYQGSLVRIAEGGSFRFRCHTGHGFSAEALLDGLLESIGKKLWQTIRSFQEASMLLGHLGRHLQENGGSAGQMYSWQRPASSTSRPAGCSELPRNAKTCSRAGR